MTQDALPSPVGLMPVREPVVRQRAPFAEGKRIAVSRQNKGELIPVVVGQNSAALQPKKKKTETQDVHALGGARQDKVLTGPPSRSSPRREGGWSPGPSSGPAALGSAPCEGEPSPPSWRTKAPCSCRSTCTLARRLHLLLRPLRWRWHDVRTTFLEMFHQEIKNQNNSKNVSESERTDRPF